MNGALQRLEARARESDMVQVATLVMATAVVTLVTTWPTPGATSNESWFAFSNVRSVLVAILALGYGASAAFESVARASATAGVVMIIAALIIPFELATYAASYPATPLWWPLVSLPLATSGYLVLGAILGRTAHALRLRALLPILVPALIVALVALDVRFGWTTLNPLTAAHDPAPRFALSMLALTLGGLMVLVLRHLRGRDVTR